MSKLFINTMDIIWQKPRIRRPTGVTSHCASWTENIFTITIEESKIGGILINDISDHLPVFAVYTDIDQKNAV